MSETAIKLKKYQFTVKHIFETTHVVEAENPHDACHIFDSTPNSDRTYGEKKLIEYAQGDGPLPICGNCGEAPENVLDLFPNWEPEGPKCCDKPAYEYPPEELEFMEEVESDPYKYA